MLQSNFLALLVLAEAEAAASSPLAAIGVNALISGVSACWLLILCKAGELTGSPENVSQIPKERKLPLDSDALVGGVLFAVGATIGIGVSVALFLNDLDAANYWLAPLGVAAVVGLLGPWPLVRKLGKDYLERARLNLEQGDFKAAMQDAAEVERISEVYKAEAREIREYASEQRGRQLDDQLRSPGDSPFDLSHEESDESLLNLSL